MWIKKEISSLLGLIIIAVFTIVVFGSIYVAANYFPSALLNAFGGLI